MLVYQEKNWTYGRLHREKAYLIIPCMALVVDDGSSKAPGGVDAGSCDGDGRQMNQEHCKADGKRSQNLQDDG